MQILGSVCQRKIMQMVPCDLWMPSRLQSPNHADGSMQFVDAFQIAIEGEWSWMSHNSK
jgi:hypothetical protein